MLLFSVHLIVILLDAYLLQFLSPRTHVHFTKKNYKACERLKTHFAGTKQASEPESNMTGMLELSDQKFLKTIIKILKVLLNKVGNMQ